MVPCRRVSDVRTLIVHQSSQWTDLVIADNENRQSRYRGIEMFYLMALGCIDDQGWVAWEPRRFTWGQQDCDRDLVAREPQRFMWGNGFDVLSFGGHRWPERRRVTDL